jgi:hypothetical protein
MNVTSTASCRCVDCAGADCRCGCNADAAPSTSPVTAKTCACGPSCGGQAAERGCTCDTISA